MFASLIELAWNAFENMQQMICLLLLLYVPELSETQNYAYWYARFFPGTHDFRYAGVPGTHVF